MKRYSFENAKRHIKKDVYGANSIRFWSQKYQFGFNTGGHSDFDRDDFINGLDFWFEDHRSFKAIKWHSMVFFQPSHCTGSILNGLLELDELSNLKFEASKEWKINHKNHYQYLVSSTNIHPAAHHDWYYIHGLLGDILPNHYPTIPFRIRTKNGRPLW